MGSHGNESREENAAHIKFWSLLLVALVSLVIGPEVVTSADLKETVRTICQATEYKETCETTLTVNTPLNDPKTLLKIALRAAVTELKQASNNVNTLDNPNSNPRTKEALENCQSLMDSAIDDLERSIIPLDDTRTRIDGLIEDLEVWLTGAITFHENCVQELEFASDAANCEKVKQILDKSKQLATNGLDIVHYFSSLTPSKRKKRDLNSRGIRPLPSWMRTGWEKLIAKRAPASNQPDVTVAQDGSGKYRTINEALKAYPANLPPNKFFTIYIKAGVYREYVTVTKNMKNVMFIGDGATKTKITGNRNFVDGVSTMNTATVAILGPSFIAKDIGFENTAGAIKHQAVALRVMADAVVFFRCQIDGYQDTLYVHAYRQFFRDCVISGTVDFVFGDAAAIFQNCNFVVKKPMKGQQCTVTAQGRSRWNKASGIVIQKSTFSVENGFVPARDKVNVFLGRPWKEYARVVILQSFMGDFINPEGWMRWSGDFAINTCYYAEFWNWGPGSSQAKRVNWKGIKKIDAREALGFTVGRFYKDNFIKASGVPYYTGLPV